MLDDANRCIRALTVVVALGAYTAGGMRLAPNARMDDGLFDVVTIDAMSVPHLLFSLCRTYSGRHVRDPHIDVELARTVYIEPSGLQTIQLDGEEGGQAPATFTVLPRAIRVHAPISR
jgi:diacylglycerol kinase (ATP)